MTVIDQAAIRPSKAVLASMSNGTGCGKGMIDRIGRDAEARVRPSDTPRRHRVLRRQAGREVAELGVPRVERAARDAHGQGDGTASSVASLNLTR